MAWRSAGRFLVLTPMLPGALTLRAAWWAANRLSLPVQARSRANAWRALAAEGHGPREMSRRQLTDLQVNKSGRDLPDSPVAG